MYDFALPSLCKLRETRKKKKRNERVEKEETDSRPAHYDETRRKISPYRGCCSIRY